MWNQLRIAQPYLLAACVFAIPMSVSLKSILLPLCIIVNLLTVKHWRIIFDTFKNPVVISALLLLGWCLLSSLWAPANWPETKAVVSKMLKLLSLPLFAIGFLHKTTRAYAQIAFLIAMTVTALISLAMALSGNIFMGGADAGTVFNDRIMTGLFVSMGAWLAAHLAMQADDSKKWWFWAVFVICTAQVVFANTGRTGYVVYALLAICFSLMHLSFRQTVLFLIAFSLLTFAAYRLSPTLAKNVDTTIDNVVNFQQVANSSSIGYRVGFHQFAKKLFVQHPIFGTGAGSFSWYYNKLQPMPFYSSRLFEPHSQYWLILVEQGLVGMLLLLAWMASLIWLMVKVKQSRAMLLFTFVAISASNFSDSMLLYSATGYLLMVVSAMALGEYIERCFSESPVNKPISLQPWHAI
ncbi:O-antigen ligase family protein [Legionella sp. W05-934-2]|uniref:O-antigen ligase family protein n=1 Tax=Legionella sp. W05-934-2 TaxID=1198649 RepID=UPI003462CEA8